jgi:hypothetical protein
LPEILFGETMPVVAAKVVFLLTIFKIATDVFIAFESRTGAQKREQSAGSGFRLKAAGAGRPSVSSHCSRMNRD